MLTVPQFGRLGHSLGTAVATGIAHRYITLETPIQFAGIILCATFTNAGNAISSYSIGGLLPVLAPVKLISPLQAWFSRRMRDTWMTDKRLVEIVRRSTSLQLVLVHAEDDLTMPWDHTEELFKATIQAAAENSPTDDEIEKRLKRIDLGEAGRQDIWKSVGTSISKLIARHGGEFFPFHRIFPLLTFSGHRP